MTTRATAPPPQCQHRTRIPGTGRTVQCQLSHEHTGQHVWHETLDTTARGTTGSRNVGAITARWTTVHQPAQPAPTH